MNRIHVVLTVARQVEGEWVFIKTEGAFRDVKNADALIRDLRAKYAAPDGQSVPLPVDTPQGQVVCACEAGGFAVDILDEQPSTSQESP